MASLHKFFLQFIHNHTFRSSLSSANQLAEVITVQLSSRLPDQKGARSSAHLGTFQRSKASIVMYLLKYQELPDASQSQSSHPCFKACMNNYDRKFPGGFQHDKTPKIQFCHPLLQTTLCIAPGGTLNAEVIGMLLGNFLENPKNTEILILNP